MMIRISLVLSLLVFFEVTLAQTGPGGVGNSSNITFWLDASSLGLSNGSAVATWTDRMGNNNFTQSTSADQPQFVTNALNSNPVVQFDGSNDCMLSSSIASLNNDNSISWVLVSNYNATNVSMDAFNASYSDNLRRFANYLTPSGSGFAGAFLRDVSGTDGYLNVANTNWRIASHIWDASLATNSFVCHENGTLESSQTNQSTIGNHNFFTLGRRSNNFVAYLNGSVSELIFFSFPIGAAQRIIIQNYLSSKYNLAINDDLYSFDGTHPNEVAGIGQESSSDNHTDAQGTGIVRINTASDMDDDEYLLWGHNGAALSSNTSELPTGFGSGRKCTREWVMDETGGDLGTITLVANLGSVSPALGVVPENTYLVFDADGNFSNATDTIAPTSVVGNVYTYTNVDASSGPYFTFINDGSSGGDCIATFGTAASAAWDATEWTCTGSFPDSTSNATIDNGWTRTVTGVESVNDLTVNGSLVLSANSTFIIKGDLSIGATGSITAPASSTVIFRGSLGAQQAATNGSGGEISLGGLTIANPNGVRLLSSDYAITGPLRLEQGAMNNEVTNFTFTSDGTSQGHLENIGSGSFGGSGNYIVERHISARTANWGDIASAGVVTDVHDLDNEIFISGVTGADGYAVSSGGGGFISMWFFNNTTDSYNAVSNVTDAMTLGRGYETWLADNMTNWNAKAVDFQGAAADLNVASTDIAVNSTGGGWNLVANPFPAFLDFSAINSDYPTIFNDEFWYYDADSAQYNSRGPNAMIPPGQGFWLNFSSGGSFNLTLDPAQHFMEGVNSAEFFKTDRFEELKIEVKGDENPLGSAAFVRKQKLAFAGEDDYDLVPLKVPDARAVNIWFENGAKESMVNFFDPAESYVEFPLTVESGLPGDYVMNFKGLRKYSEFQCMNLVDEQTGEQIQLSPGASYRFIVDEDLSPLNFTLILSKEDYEDCIAPTDAMDNEIRVFAHEKMIFADFFLDRGAEASFEVFNILGNRVYSSSETVGYSRETIDLSSVETGVYFVSISVNGQTTTEKVILK